MSGWSGPSTRSRSATSGSPTAMACAALSPSSFRWYSAHRRSRTSNLASSSSGPPDSPATASCSAVTCSGMSRTAGRSSDPASAPARASSTEAAARHTAASRPRWASRSRTTRSTRRCAMTAWPSRLKVSSDRSASRPSAASTTAAAHPGPGLAAGQHARLPGGVQQVPADPGRRQHAHHLQHPGTHPGLVTRPDRLQGQQHRLGHPMRVRLPRLPGQVLRHRQRPQPLQVRPVRQVLPGDHRRGLGQRQRQEPQLGGHRPGPRRIGQAGPVRPGTPAPPPRRTPPPRRWSPGSPPTAGYW